MVDRRTSTAVEYRLAVFAVRSSCSRWSLWGSPIALVSAARERFGAGARYGVPSPGVEWLGHPRCAHRAAHRPDDCRHPDPYRPRCRLGRCDRGRADGRRRSTSHGPPRRARHARHPRFRSLTAGRGSLHRACWRSCHCSRRRPGSAGDGPKLLPDRAVSAVDETPETRPAHVAIAPVVSEEARTPASADAPTQVGTWCDPATLSSASPSDWPGRTPPESLRSRKRLVDLNMGRQMPDGRRFSMQRSSTWVGYSNYPKGCRSSRRPAHTNKWASGFTSWSRAKRSGRSPSTNSVTRADGRKSSPRTKGGGTTTVVDSPTQT